MREKRPKTTRSYESLMNITAAENDEAELRKDDDDEKKESESTSEDLDLGLGSQDQDQEKNPNDKKRRRDLPSGTRTDETSQNNDNEQNIDRGLAFEEAIQTGENLESFLQMTDDESVNPNAREIKFPTLPLPSPPNSPHNQVRVQESPSPNKS